MRASELFQLLRYSPHRGQIVFHESDARFKVLIAGARFGKSLAGSRDVLTDLASGPTRGWLVGPSYALAAQEFRYLQQDLRRIAGLACDVRDGGRTGHSLIRTPWGGEILSLSAHSPEGLLGEEVDWMLLCEAAHIKREAFERFLRARLASRQGRLVVPTTPRGRNWIHELYQHGLSEPGWASFHYATWDNPAIAQAEIEAARRQLPPEVFAEQFGGEFTLGAGRVYAAFNPATHVVKGLEAPPGAVVHRAIDYGFRNLTVCLWGTADPDDRTLILREHCGAGMNMDEHAARIRAIDAEFAAKGHTMGVSFADPAGLGYTAQMARCGLVFSNATTGVLAGINLVRQALVANAQGPGLLIDASCKVLIRELTTYHWDDAPEGVESRPVKVDDHAVDALRYLIAGLARRVGWNSGNSLW